MDFEPGAGLLNVRLLIGSREQLQKRSTGAHPWRRSTRRESARGVWWATEVVGIRWNQSCTLIGSRKRTRLYADRIAEVGPIRQHRRSRGVVHTVTRAQHQALMQEAAKVEWLTKALKAEQARTISERIWTRVKALLSHAPSPGPH